MPKLNTVMELLDKLDSLEIGVHTERCTLVRNRHSSCSCCADACPTGCITVDNQGGINVVPELCIGCGICTTVCPTCALEPLRPNDAELASMGIKANEQSEGKPCFACQKLLKENKKYDQGKVVSLKCLGRLEEGVLVGLASTGAKEIRLACGDCKNCDYQLGIETANMIIESTNNLLKDWDENCECTVKLYDGKLPSDVVLMDDDSEAVDAISRRDFFTQVKSSATSIASEQALKAIKPEEEEVEVNLLTKVGKGGNLPYFIPNRRERLLDSLERLCEQPTSEEIDTRLWGQVEIDGNKCASCRMCAVFCPTGAITNYDGKDGSIGIINRPADCVQCGLCQDICFKSALTLSTITNPYDLLDGMERKILMAPRAVENNRPDSMYRTLKNLLGADQIYER